MIEVTIKFDDLGWRVDATIPDAGEGEIKGWGSGPLARFEDVMRFALDNISNQDRDAMIKIKRSVSKAALRDMTRVVA